VTVTGNFQGLAHRKHRLRIVGKTASRATMRLSGSSGRAKLKLCQSLSLKARCHRGTACLEQRYPRTVRRQCVGCGCRVLSLRRWR
jgi:hypothetical protein